MRAGAGGRVGTHRLGLAGPAAGHHRTHPAGPSHSVRLASDPPHGSVPHHSCRDGPTARRKFFFGPSGVSGTFSRLRSNACIRQRTSAHERAVIPRGCVASPSWQRACSSSRRRSEVGTGWAGGRSQSLVGPGVPGPCAKVVGGSRGGRAGVFGGDGRRGRGRGRRIRRPRLQIRSGAAGEVRGGFAARRGERRGSALLRSSAVPSVKAPAAADVSRARSSRRRSASASR
jgi:hypothetical protein